MGQLATGRERWAAAAQLLAGAEALRETIGTQIEPDELAVHEDLLRTVAAALGEERFTTLWTAGRALPLGDLLAMASAETGTEAPPKADPGTLSPPEPHPRADRVECYTCYVAAPSDQPNPGPYQLRGPDRGCGEPDTGAGPHYRPGHAPAHLDGRGRQRQDAPGPGGGGRGARRLSPTASGWWSWPPCRPALTPDRRRCVAATLAALGLHEQPGQALLDTLVDAPAAQAPAAGAGQLRASGGCLCRAGRRAAGACPGLRILATSQQALGVADETVWRVVPLAQCRPVDGCADARGARLPGSREAVQLFVERAQAVQPGFALSAENAAAVAADLPAAGRPAAGHRAGRGAGAASCRWRRSLARLDDRFRLLTRRARAPPARAPDLAGDAGLELRPARARRAGAAAPAGGVRRRLGRWRRRRRSARATVVEAEEVLDAAR